MNKKLARLWVRIPLGARLFNPSVVRHLSELQHFSFSLKNGCLATKQPWAGCPGGDKIPTKVGSGRVEIGIGMTFYPDRRDFSRSG